MDIMDFVRALFLATESYNLLAHVVVFAGIRMLPRKDLVRSHYYFLFDTISVCLATAFCVQRMWWLAVLQCIQHVHIWLNWDIADYVKQVITWSSLESFSINGGRRFSGHLMFSVIGTLFDISTHAVMCYFLYTDSTTVIEPMIALALLLLLCRFGLFNPRFAWSTPGQEDVWVKKRFNTNVAYQHLRFPYVY